MVSIHIRSKSDNVLTRTHSPDFDGTDAGIMWDAKAQGVNKKLMRLAVDSRSSTKRQSLMFDESGAAPVKTEVTFMSKSSDDIPCRRIKHKRPDAYGDEEANTRFPRMEEMSHFHYSAVDFEGKVKVSFRQLDNDVTSLDTGQSLLVQVTSKDKSWIVKRSQEDFVGLDRQIHRCLYDRRYSTLPELKDCEEGTPLDEEMVQQMQYYLNRFSELTGNNLNCGPILNWLELDNHGNHLVVMEADDSAINVPAVAAGRAIKRYQAQAPDEMSLEVGDFLSVIDMPPSEETIWWRGKKGFEVGFFPSHCIEILGEKEINEQILTQLQARPVSKRRGKFISFLRFFFKSRPSKDELMQSGILRERVFGCDLGERLALTGRDIPMVLEMCGNVVEEHGIVDGIYRLSGIVSNLQKLRVAFDCDEQPPNLRDPKYLNDIHCISSLLKTYFRELPNPLFTYELYDKFVMAINKDDDTERTVAFHHVIQRLPPPHYRTMNYLLRHLNYCASKADETNMTAKNLAIVWAPNLLRPNVDDSVAALTEFRTQAIIVEYMIRNVDVFFDKNLASAAIAYYPEIQDVPLEADNECARIGTQSNGPKLITLEEARERVHKQRNVTQTTSVDGNPNNSRQSKLKSTYIPPKVSAAPISPLPSLLSIEEAQARTKNKNEMTPSSLLDTPETRDIGSVNSPRRSRKWFGLFQKSSKTNASEDELHVKPGVTYYTKKPSPVISGPARSQSEYRLQDLQKRQEHDKENIYRTESYDSTTPSVDTKSLRDSQDSLNAPVATPELDLDTRLSDNEGDSIMSAIVSVTAKYIDVEDPLRYHTPRRSFTIGSTSEFRKLNDSELNVEPPSNIKDNNNTLDRGKVTPVDNVPGTPYSNHRPAPSIDSGYLSQGSTLNRLKDFDTTEKPTFNNSPERKQTRSSERIGSESEEDVPYKRIRSLSPECSKVPLESPVNSNNSTNNTKAVVTRKFSRSEFYRNKTSSPDSRSKSISENPQTTDASPYTSVTPSSKPGTPSSSQSDYKPPNVRKASVEPMQTSPRTLAFNSTENRSMETNIKVSPEIKRDETNFPERPNTLNLNRNNTNGLDLTPDSDGKYTKRRSIECATTPKSPDSRMILSSKHNKVTVNRQSLSSPITKTSENRRSLSSPITKTPDARSNFSLATTTRTSTDRGLKRTSGEFKLTKHSNDNISISSNENTSESVQWRYVQENECSEKISARRQSVGNIVKVASAYIGADYNERETNTTPTTPTTPITPTTPKDKIKTRRSSVRDVARMFDEKSNGNSRPTDHPPKARPISNPIPSKLMTSSHRNEKTKSSPNLYNSSDYSIDSGKGEQQRYRRRQQKSEETVNPMFYTAQKPTDKIDDSTSASCPSYKDFDLRCRVKDINQINHQLSSPGENKQHNEPHRTRSTDRLVLSTGEKIQTAQSGNKARPQSEIIQGFNLCSMDKSENEPEIPATSSRSAYSMKPRNLSNSLHASKSENKLSCGSQDGTRQIGNFPLTLKCGSAQGSRASFDAERVQKRPLSMYDNSRSSYYDNVNSIRYEML